MSMTATNIMIPPPVELRRRIEQRRQEIADLKKLLKMSSVAERVLLDRAADPARRAETVNA